MKKILLIILLLLKGLNAFSQECESESFVLDEKHHTPNIDSIFKLDVEMRIEFYADLNNRIIPKYFGLKKTILQEIDKDDFKMIFTLKSIYESQINSYSEEMNNTHQDLFFNTAPYSKLNLLLVFETLKTFPDTYAMIFNSTVLNRNMNNEDEVIKRNLNSKYFDKLKKYSDCIEDLYIDIQESKQKYKIIDIMQNTGQKTEKDKKDCDTLDLLIWAIQ
ncbi:hypothetical protein [Aquiflexum gelatinilyticum]|uniref:Uncharacterized protein n=1 Tax=Aquiflexum gelatinilyticum TaxID=2961943 RepID=A0A9X2SXT2_9BACT|nr:hypothetical protein [Aquiflexum gelatinilyticum]MCR9014312.1 hypothetical protein [Aquiflexum gelatinilyticum]